MRSPEAHSQRTVTHSLLSVNSVTQIRLTVRNWMQKVKESTQRPAIA